MLGSVQAITLDGALVVVSYSASQIGPYASGAGRVILVVGSQKIVGRQVRPAPLPPRSTFGSPPTNQPRK
jgi:hypothetical protein